MLLACMLASSVARAAGQLYGTLETTGGERYTGAIRWGEKAFWDETLSGKRPLAGEAPADAPKRAHFSLFGVRLFQGDDSDRNASFVVPFGDIRSIAPHGNQAATIELRNGDLVEVGVGSAVADIGPGVGSIGIDDTKGHVDLPWHEVRRVQFAVGPPTAPGARSERLWGKATTKAGVFTGLVRWDDDEDTLDDELDGRADGRKWSLSFREIASIAPDGPQAARVVLRDGRELVLSGTNDVNADFRGLVVETAPNGIRVKIEWDALVRLELTPLPALAGYDSYTDVRALRGTVELKDGTTRAGRIVWDRDESYGFQRLEGDADGISWSIPFAKIAAIRPLAAGGSKVVLRDGRELTLDGSNDVGQGNRGVVVEAGDTTTVLSIDVVQSVDLD
jgi:hypothetical protein